MIRPFKNNSKTLVHENTNCIVHLQFTVMTHWETSNNSVRFKVLSTELSFVMKNSV